MSLSSNSKNVNPAADGEDERRENRGTIIKVRDELSAGVDEKEERRQPTDTDKVTEEEEETGRKRRKDGAREGIGNKITERGRGIRPGV